MAVACSHLEERATDGEHFGRHRALRSDLVRVRPIPRMAAAWSGKRDDEERALKALAFSRVEFSLFNSKTRMWGRLHERRAPRPSRRDAQHTHTQSTPKGDDRKKKAQEQKRRFIREHRLLDCLSVSSETFCDGFLFLYRVWRGIFVANARGVRYRAASFVRAFW